MHVLLDVFLILSAIFPVCFKHLLMLSMFLETKFHVYDMMVSPVSCLVQSFLMPADF